MADDDNKSQPFDPDQMIECIKELVRVDKNWIPRKKGFSLYIRPTMIGTQASLGVGASSECLLYVITSPVGPYFPSGFKPIRLMASTEYVRAWPGGTGGHKLAAFVSSHISPSRPHCAPRSRFGPLSERKNVKRKRVTDRLCQTTTQFDDLMI